jgi:crossover junction endodeoxyribonuclease RuvC
LLVLGIDPGTYSMGVGAVEVDGDQYAVTLSTALSPPRKAEIAERLAWLHEQLDSIVKDLNPEVVAIESPFVSRNVKAAVAVGQSQAVAMIAAASHGVPVATYAPREVKKAVTDYGGSSKEQVQEMVKVLLDLQEPPQPSDAADALAVAICHINASQGRDALLLRP